MINDNTPHEPLFLSADEADLALLATANEKFKFAIPIGVALPEPLQLALERGMDNDWFTLIDISPAANVQMMLRIFRLTEQGKTRLKQCEARAMLTRGSSKPLVQQA